MLHLNKISKLAQIYDILKITPLKSRSVSTTPILSHRFIRLGGWRLRQGLPARGTEYGPLADLPDWSYADGRPAPLAINQKKRAKLQKNYCEQIIKLSKEVDECYELNKEKAEMEEQRKQHAIKNRLKTKGKRFL